MKKDNANPLNVIDISNVNVHVAHDLVKAAKSQGFLMIEGHGFTQDEVDKLFKLGKDYFEQPMELKSKFPMDDFEHGYASYHLENLDPTNNNVGDPKESFNIAYLDFKKGNTRGSLPEFFQDNNRQFVLEKTFKKLYDLSLTILKLLAMGLEIKDTDKPGDEWFLSRYDPEKASGSVFRFLHYPLQSKLDPENEIRAGAHTDYGSVTLLFQRQNEEGLEILSPISKVWEAVPFVPSSPNFPGVAPPIIVNIGDLLNYWTNGLLKSTTHRVKLPKASSLSKDRYSIVFFSHPNDDAILSHVPSDMVQTAKDMTSSEEITAKEHLDRRLQETYATK